MIPGDLVCFPMKNYCVGIYLGTSINPIFGLLAKVFFQHGSIDEIHIGWLKKL